MRLELEKVTREGLAKIGATAEQIAHVLEPGISDEELVRRSKEAMDAARARGSRDPIGAALAAAGPGGHTLVALAGTGSLQAVIHGTPEQARAFAAHLAKHDDAMRTASYR